MRLNHLLYKAIGFCTCLYIYLCQECLYFCIILCCSLLCFYFNVYNSSAFIVKRNLVVINSLLLFEKMFPSFLIIIIICLKDGETVTSTDTDLSPTSTLPKRDYARPWQSFRSSLWVETYLLEPLPLASVDRQVGGWNQERIWKCPFPSILKLFGQICNSFGRCLFVCFILAHWIYYPTSFYLARFLLKNLII